MNIGTFVIEVEYIFSEIKLQIKKGEAIPVTGREGPLGCETSRLPHFL
jgi:hypothetical protein